MIKLSRTGCVACFSDRKYGIVGVLEHSRKHDPIKKGVASLPHVSLAVQALAVIRLAALVLRVIS